MTTPANLQRGLALFVQAQALQKSRRFQEAATAFTQALALVPGHPGIVDAFAQLAAEVRDWRAAEKLLRRLIDLQPGNAGHEDRYARCLGHLGRWQEARAHAERAWSLQQSAGILFGLMNTLHQLGCRHELDSLVPLALERFADNTAIRAVCATHLLKSGDDYARAFAMLADMRAVADPTSNVRTAIAASSWDGKPFAGTLRVVADAGLGDQLLGASMLPDLVRIGQRTQFICEPRLQALLQRSFPDIECIAADARGQARINASLDAENDRHITAIELGRFFRRLREDFPPAAGWLRADQARTRAVAAGYAGQWPGTRLVGLSWKSARQMEDGAGKGIDLAAFAPLLARTDGTFISLQYGDVAEEIRALRSAGGVQLHVDAEIDATRDIDGLAAQISALDLVITTSNVTAHIAGALGKPCWLLLPQARPVLWYWGYDGERTPWYPSIRIFRNTRDNGDWRELIDRIGNTLAAEGIAPGA